MTNTRDNTKIFVLLGAVVGLLVVFVFTQIDRGDQPDAVTENAGLTNEATDEQLRSVALILNDLANIRAALEMQMLEAEGQREQARLQQEASALVSETLTRHGMQVEEYSQILLTIDRDPDVRERFQNVQQDVDGGAPGSE